MSWDYMQYCNLWLILIQVNSTQDVILYHIIVYSNEDTRINKMLSLELKSLSSREGEKYLILI